MIFALPKFSQFCLSVSCVVGLFVATQATVCAHVYEDGFVERSLTITIRDGVGYGEYQIGLNAKTANEILQLAKLAEGLKREDTGSKLLKGQTTAVEHPDLSKPLKPVSSPEDVDTDQAADPDKTSTPKPTASPQKLTTDDAGEHLTDLATIRQFGELQSQWFTDHLKVSSDGHLVKLTTVVVEPAARHPYSVLVKFQFSLENKDANAGLPVVEKASVDSKPDPPADRVVDFQVSDGLFAGHAGAVRYSLRARGATMLLQSNVAPVLVRAERVEINKKASAGKEKIPAIEAKLNLGAR